MQKIKDRIKESIEVKKRILEDPELTGRIEEAAEVHIFVWRLVGYHDAVVEILGQTGALELVLLVEVVAFREDNHLVGTFLM